MEISQLRTPVRMAARLALLASAVVLSAITAEFLLRMFHPQQLIRRRPDVYRPDEGLGWRFRADLETRVNTGERSVSLRTDEHGYRIGTHPPECSPELRVLAIGDSFIEALSVEYEDSLIGLLETELSARLGRTVRIYNTGVAGYSPDQYQVVAARSLEDLKLDLIVVFVYLGNDLVTESADSIPARLPAIDHPLRMPTSFAFEDWKISVFYPVNDFFEVRSHLYIMARTNGRTLLARLGLTPYYFPEALRERSISSLQWSVTAAIFEDIHSKSRTRGVPTLFVLLPSVQQVDRVSLQWHIDAFDLDPSDIDIDLPNRQLGAAMAERGLRVIDVMPALRRAYSTGMKDLYGDVDKHFGRGGHAIVAQTLAPEIVRELGTGTRSSRR